MSLKETILQDMKVAMRSKDASRLESIRMLRAAIQRKEVDDRSELNDDQVLAIVQKMLKQSQDAIQQFQDGGRDDLVAKEQVLIDHLQVYMPEQLADEEIEQLINQAIADSGAESMRDMGKVMAILKPQLAGKADMGQVSGKIKARLG